MKHLISIGLVAGFIGTLAHLPSHRFTPIVAGNSKTQPSQASNAHPSSDMQFMKPNTLAERQEIEQAFAESNKHQRASYLMYEAGNLAGAEQECHFAMNTAPFVGRKRARLPNIEIRLGQIYLREGRNQEALAVFQGFYNNTFYSTKDSDIALAYARLGNYAQARRFYSDRAITQCRITEQPLKPSDLPGTENLQSLTASILFAQGINEYFTDERNYALADFMAASRLAPDNALIAYYTARALYEKGQYAEAIPFYEQVVASPRVAIYYDAKYNLHNAQIYVQEAQRAAQKRAAK
jgi:tetratricopeptide (TPR) repeat protein